MEEGSDNKSDRVAADPKETTDKTADTEHIEPSHQRLQTTDDGQKEETTEEEKKESEEKIETEEKKKTEEKMETEEKKETDENGDKSNDIAIR